HTGRSAQGRLRGDRAVRQRGGDDTRPMDRPLRAGRGGLCGDHRQRAPACRLANDRLRPLAIVAAGLYSARFLTAIDAAMAVQPKQRPADHTEFRALMGDIEAPATVSLAPRPDLMQEPFGGAVASEREVTVPDRPLLAGAEPIAATAAAPETRPPAPVPAPQKAPARP